MKGRQRVEKEGAFDWKFVRLTCLIDFTYPNILILRFLELQTTKNLFPATQASVRFSELRGS
jgi:hypothetical protein